MAIDCNWLVRLSLPSRFPYLFLALQSIFDRLDASDSVIKADLHLLFVLFHFEMHLPNLFLIQLLGHSFGKLSVLRLAKIIQEHLFLMSPSLLFFLFFCSLVVFLLRLKPLIKLFLQLLIHLPLALESQIEFVHIIDLLLPQRELLHLGLLLDPLLIPELPSHNLRLRLL